MDTDTSQFIAVKTVPIKDGEWQEYMHSLQQEIALLQNLSHPNIVQYLGTEFHEDDGTFNILLEYVPGGSISKLLSWFGSLGEKVRCTLSFGVPIV